uniref:Uncharacterized protein n=1 Tax=Anguilla anguilla TaxID=7936 RepID=A0A0E9WIC8_ANGAN
MIRPQSLLEALRSMLFERAVEKATVYGTGFKNVRSSQWHPGRTPRYKSTLTLGLQL